MTKLAALALLCGAFFVDVSAAAMVRPSLRHEAGGNKTNNYLTEGFFAGGDRKIAVARIKDIRRAKSDKGFERVVFDVEGQGEGSDGLPYFQVQAAPGEGRFVVSIWANVQYEFDVEKVRKNFAKSAHFKRLNIMPRLEEGLAIIELTLASGDKKNPKFEVFSLPPGSGLPSRIIIDVM